MRGRGSRLRTGAALAATGVALVLAATASADHVSVELSAVAKLGERVGDSWRIEVEWAINCRGATSPRYFGDLNVLEQGGEGERFYLGGTFGPRGTTTLSVAMKESPRRLKPHMKSACGEGSGILHGSPFVEFLGNEVVVPALACDPDLLAKASREYEVSKSFYLAVGQDLRNIRQEAKKTIAEKLKEKGMKKAAKQALKDLLVLFSDDAAQAVSVTLWWVKIGVIVQKIVLEVLPRLNEIRKAHAEAHADFRRGEEWAKRARATLDAALRQGPCTGALRARLDAALDLQRREEAARALVESWENNGYLYINPATGETLDEAAALREARKALEGGGRTTQARGTATPRRITATKSQIQAAIARLTRAEALGDRVLARVRRSDAAAGRLQAGLAAVWR